MKDKMDEACSTCDVNARNLNNVNEHNTKKNLNEMRYGIVCCIQLPQERIKCRDVLKMVTHLQAHKSREFNY
jgi:hypothetical protein